MRAIEGTFRIDGGHAFVAGSGTAKTESGVNRAKTLDNPSPNDVVTPDDVIIQGSACIGLDCVSDESFGFDTLRLKENNTRIKFNDTSVGAGFPNTNWQLTANDSASGGLNKFSIEDVTTPTVPFTVLGGAPDNSIYIASNGKIGLRTTTPLLDVHLVTGDTPAIRLDQSGGGFTPQTWDIGGNEANFFVRDTTGGSRLPFRIRPGAPTSSIDISAAGNVGIGTASPTAKLDIVYIGNVGAPVPVLRFTNTDPSVDVSQQDRFTVDSAGNVLARGTISQLSSRSAKENFHATDGRLLLAKLEKMPVDSWNYRGAPEEERHLGPVAEDFHAAFGLGKSNRYIAPTDMAGVALWHRSRRCRKRSSSATNTSRNLSGVCRRWKRASTRLRAEDIAMNFRRCVLSLFALATGSAVLNTAAAAVLALAPTAHGNSIHVIDVATRNSTVLEAAACCAVEAGSVAADVAHHRVYFLSNRSGGADLYTFGYAATAVVSSIAITAGRRVSHLDYDPLRARLVGFVVEDAGGIDVATVDPVSGNVVVTGVLGPSCCTLRAGVSAYAASADRLYAVGRRSGDITDQLLVFSVGSGTLQAAYDLGSESVLELVADGGSLYALSYAQGSAVLRVASITFAPAFSLSPIGSGSSDCCYVLAGSAAIDHAKNTLDTLARSNSTSEPFAIRAFSLSSGNVTIGQTVPAMGLFEDTAVLFDRIFADSFE